MKNNLIKTAAAVPMLKVGDISYNARQITELIDQHANCGLIVFPELSLTGYTCADLFQSDLLLREAETALVKIAETTHGKGITALVGIPIPYNNCIYNCGAVLSQGQVKAIIPKSYIPNYSEFYECRWFEPGKGIFRKSVRIGDLDVPFGTDIIAEDPDTGAVLGVELCGNLAMTFS